MPRSLRVKALGSSALAVALFLFSCTRPLSREYFVGSGERNGLGQYIFALDLSDSLVHYDLSLLLSSACGRDRFEDFGQTPLYIRRQSPSGKVVDDTLSVSYERFTHGAFFSRQAMLPYVLDLAPAEYGLWSLAVYVPEVCVSRYKITGIGLKIERVRWDTEN